MKKCLLFYQKYYIIKIKTARPNGTHPSNERNGKKTMSTQKAVLSIDPKIVSLLGNRLYTQDTGIIILRECLQNSIDAGATVISVEYSDNVLTIADNGIGITDFNAYMFTIGGTSKNGGGNVGGYGIAKLALLAQKEWYMQSQAGRIDHNSLATGQIDETDSIPHGCIVACKIGYINLGYLYDICALTVNSKVDITLNGELVECPILSPVESLPIKKWMDGKVMTNHIVVRLNGQYQFSDYIFEECTDGICIYDITTTESPYSDLYPLSANRESISDNDIKSEYQQVKDCLTKMIKQLRISDEIAKQRIRNNGKYYIGGGISLRDLRDTSLMSNVRTYERYIRQLYAMDNNNEDLNFLITDIGDFNAARVVTDGIVYYAINPDKCKDMDKSEMFAIAIHEYTHNETSGHSEYYANKQTDITARVFRAILRGEFRR